ncbi:helix-turn-helix domain-containing protein [Polyangium jinanense]|uniref:Helix-turn-helix domain-containing protein n=1 Tax=Polyangium jinanense TaxID=2829994 RepID=A0A9X3X8N4_9BACT|nr:helix-turn-helix domain-containing protein [Polyangium jinanense]MDC3985784.1 helix-turn-helix domain-containing protein [Polyangium jinanense]
MATHELPPEVIAALATLLRYAGSIMREAIEANPGGNGGGFYDAKTAPMGRTAFLRLAREGAFKATKIGRKVLARKDEVDAWIESRATIAPHRSAREAHTSDGYGDALALHEANRATNDNPPPRRAKPAGKARR